MFSAVSLFSNCGAGDVGYRSAGFRFDVMAELDERRLDVALLNHPGAVGVPGDLRKTWRKVVKEYQKRAGNRRPALLCACPPCQGMSSARSGKGWHEDAEAGSKDERNLLVTVIARVAKELEPALIVVENVPAFLTRKVRHPETGNPVSAANYLISKLTKYYEVFPVLADLCHYAVPQTRHRAFLTFVRRDVRMLGTLKRLSRIPFPRPTHDPSLGGGEPITIRSALDSFKLASLDAACDEKASSRGHGGLHVVPVWDERVYRMVSSIPKNSGKSAWDNKSCATCGGVDVDAESVLCPKCGEALLKPIVIEPDGKARLIRGFKSSYRRMFPDRPAATVTTASGHIGSDFTIHPSENRLLSTLECALLQTFPKTFDWGDALQLYGHTNVREMIGEAVPPAFTKAHGLVLKGLLRPPWRLAPLSASDDRCVRAWRKLQEAANSSGKRQKQYQREMSARGDFQ
ncbi:MAG: DNA cytosine methyltransferase [Rhodospirillales bacterium]|nr:DNA cytosine methyltransferase [Rhodospirillales bacterium]